MDKTKLREKLHNETIVNLNAYMEILDKLIKRTANDQYINPSQKNQEKNNNYIMFLDTIVDELNNRINYFIC